MTNKPKTDDELVSDVNEENKKLRELLEFALAGLSSVPHSWGYGITHVKTIERRLADMYKAQESDK